MCLQSCKVNLSRGGHAFGAVAGFLVGLLILKNRRVDSWELIMQTVTFISFCLFVVTLLVWHIVGTDWFEATGTIGTTSCEPDT